MEIKGYQRFYAELYIIYTFENYVYVTFTSSNRFLCSHAPCLVPIIFISTKSYNSSGLIYHSVLCYVLQACHLMSFTCNNPNCFHLVETNIPFILTDEFDGLREVMSEVLRPVITDRNLHVLKVWVIVELVGHV